MATFLGPTRPDGKSFLADQGTSVEYSIIVTPRNHLKEAVFIRITFYT